MSGELITLGDPANETARRAYHGMSDKPPALVVHRVDVADVIATVNFAREQGLAVAIRGVVPTAAGLSICDGGLVIDPSRMKGGCQLPDGGTGRTGADHLPRPLPAPRHDEGKMRPNQCVQR